jgi:hypothetical protein
MSGIGNEVLVRKTLEQIADAAVAKHAQANPPPAVKSEIPAPLKWAGGIVSAILSTGIVALCLWMVATLSALQQTVTRIDERQQMTGPEVTKRLDKMDERLTRLEHRDTIR